MQKLKDQIKQAYNRKGLLWKQIKNSYKSLTIWFNTAGIAILTAALAEPLVLEYLDEKGLMLVILVGNTILRFKTNKGLEEKK